MDREQFLKLDYFVFSSHKTMTQSMRVTLTHSGFNCAHSHRLSNLKLEESELESLCRDYLKRNGRKLRILSVFRDPIDRLISSFFQFLSVEKYGRTFKGRQVSLREMPFEQLKKESVLFLENFERIQERFWYYCATNDGMGESLQLPSEAFAIPQYSFHYDPTGIFCKNELDCIELYVVRFDLLKHDFQKGMENVLGHTLAPKLANVTDNKWYTSAYTDFRKRMKIPRIFLVNMYESRRDLCNVFYPGEYQALLQQRISRYAL